MAEIRFETGVVEYSLNDKVTVSFNPTDSTFVERLFNAFERLDDVQQNMQSSLDADTENEKMFAILKGAEEEMRTIINDTFGKEICNDLFGETSVYALAGGLPLWANLYLAIIDEIDAKFTSEQSATNPRIQKYTAKYKRGH